MSDESKKNDSGNVSVRHITNEVKDPYLDFISDATHEKKREDNNKRELGGGYTVAVNSGHAGTIIVPKFNPVLLASFAEESSSLAPCVAAMEVNIDGTGFDIVPTNEKDWKDNDGNETSYEDDKEYQSLLDLFEHPYPNENLITIRRKIRRDMEQTGSGALEVMLANDGTVLYLRYLDAKYLRLIEYDDSDFELFQNKIMRNGREINAPLKMRKRRYIYQKGKTTRYLKELGAQRHLDAKTGQWAAQGSGVSLANRASAVIHFKVDKDANDEYALPRWISKVRSMKGEIEAENLNLSYFENGGIPPVIIFLQNGKVADGSINSLNAALSGRAGAKNKGVVVETESTGGSLDKESKVDIKVERFSSEQTKDIMFGGFLDRCGKDVKGAYRLPQLFLGKSEDYNYATAYASILVAEAQVFRPERDEFDDIINQRIVSGITNKFMFKSRPLSVIDTDTKLKMINDLLTRRAITNEEAVRLANLIADFEIQYSGTEGSSDLLGALTSADLTPNSDAPDENTGTDLEPDTSADNGSSEEQKSEATGVDLAQAQRVANTFASMIRKQEVNKDDLLEARRAMQKMDAIGKNVVAIKLAREIDPDGNTLDVLGTLNAAAVSLLTEEA
ncbi:hypothetical protein [Vibrio phage vB_VhaS-a]|nr:hypothetical protein [Vibrio phage vB_VhaS-a]